MCNSAENRGFRIRGLAKTPVYYPRRKRLIASDGIDLEEVLRQHEYFNDRSRFSAGWGTLLTNDFRGCHPRGERELEPIPSSANSHQPTAGLLSSSATTRKPRPRGRDRSLPPHLRDSSRMRNGSARLVANLGRRIGSPVTESYRKPRSQGMDRRAADRVFLQIKEIQ